MAPVLIFALNMKGLRVNLVETRELKMNKRIAIFVVSDDLRHSDCKLYPCFNLCTRVQSDRLEREYSVFLLVDNVILRVPFGFARSRLDVADKQFRSGTT